MAIGQTYPTRAGARRPQPGIGPSATPTGNPALDEPAADPTPNTPAPTTPQYENVGHEGSVGGMNREQWRDAWMGSGVKNRADTDSWLTSHGARKLADNGTFQTPHGEVLDLGMNYRTDSVTPGWTQTGIPDPPMNYAPSGTTTGATGGIGPSGQGTGIDPAMMTLFQQFLTNMNKPQVAAKQPKTATYNRQNKNPRSMTQARQRY